MNKSYVISVATALSLGYAAGFATDNITAQASVERTQTEIVNKRLSESAKATIESYVQSQACEEVNTKYDLTGELACDVTRDLLAVSIIWSEEEGARVADLAARFELGGSWSPGTPQ